MRTIFMTMLMLSIAPAALLAAGSEPQASILDCSAAGVCTELGSRQTMGGRAARMLITPAGKKMLMEIGCEYVTEHRELFLHIKATRVDGVPWVMNDGLVFYIFQKNSTAIIAFEAQRIKDNVLLVMQQIKEMMRLNESDDLDIISITVERENFTSISSGEFKRGLKRILSYCADK